MTQPKTVLADEPTSSLDHKTGEGILQLMKEINGNFKTTFIFSSHYVRVMVLLTEPYISKTGSYRRKT